MVKAARRSRALSGPTVPKWIGDPKNQEEWNARFKQVLERDYKVSDPAVEAILSNQQLSQECAIKIRSYVDKSVTDWLYGQRKDRGTTIKKQLDIAIAGLKAAIEIYRDKGDKQVTVYLGTLVVELSGFLGRCKSAFATKRHGRDRAHSTLSECSSFLESELQQRLTYVTLANLVNAGHEADGKTLKEPVTEEQIRKNLTAFRRNNPLWPQ